MIKTDLLLVTSYKYWEEDRTLRRLHAREGDIGLIPGYCK
jgi:hypothetical protein